MRRAGEELGEPGGVEDVAFLEVEARVSLELRAGERVAVQVVDGDHLVRVDEPSREGGPDEAGAARNHDALALERHAGIVVEPFSGPFRDRRERPAGGSPRNAPPRLDVSPSARTLYRATDLLPTARA
jgi:hypothetical protein